jgi:hypothetical protein
MLIKIRGITEVMIFIIIIKVMKAFYSYKLNVYILNYVN